MDGVQRAFNDFWENKNGIQDKFIHTWEYYLSCFDDCKNIIALDWFNEPYVHKSGREVFTELLSNIFKITYGVNINFSDCFSKKSDKAGFAASVVKILKTVNSPDKIKKLLNVMDKKENFDKAVSGLEKYTAEFNKDY